MTLRINEYSDGYKKIWRDSNKPIEEQLNEFFIGVFLVAAAHKKATLRREEESRCWRAEQERKEQERIQKIEDEKRLLALEQDVSAWVKSNQVRDFVKRVRLEIESLKLSDEKMDEFRMWELWALNHADAIDTIKKTVAAFCNSKSV